MRLPLAALAIAVGLAGCAEDEPTAEERRAEVVTQLTQDLLAETDGALSSDAARCVADELVDTFGEERFDELVGAVGDEDSPVRDQVIDVFASCDALEPLFPE